MAGPEDKRPDEHAAAEPGATEPAPTTEDRLEVARRFLDDETDLSDAEIDTLLGPSADPNSTPEPMLAQLTAARLDLHASASAHVSALNARLQDVVSEIPEAAVVVSASSHAHAHATAGSDCSSECEDPSELFHRDIGTQTSDAVPSPFRLAKLARSLADVKEGLDAQADDMHDYLAIIDNLRDDLRQSSVSRSYASLGWKQPEPDDEVKKAKDNIRRLKGVFLSARNFPVSAK
ncbi:unnamed protein product [Parascedosporium putredinis]|uniref:Peroxin-14 n=1 Tax=Parascedosporium putredinis TaxID=1442378 RepID=A0A9P1M623_9PEZI|nr:unnamed protein product [Parascedosporium putredinis]CAI7988868.1 unnamed protein product [Parascedosporium putredinis]